MKKENNKQRGRKKGGVALILLTIKNKEKQKIILNHKKIDKIEKINDTIIYLENNSIIRVEEDENEIVDKIINYEAEIIARAHILKEKGE